MTALIETVSDVEGAAPPPERGTEPESARFLNRELSWMAFNERVLDEADNASHPLLERLRFLSISDSNLDEFFMVRYAGFKRIARDQLAVLSQDGLTAEQHLSAIRARADELVRRQQRCWQSLTNALRAEGIFVTSGEEANEADREYLLGQFRDRLLTILTPIAIDPAHPFPFIPNRSLAMMVELRRPDGSEINGLVVLPERVPRFLRLPGAGARFIAIEQALLAVGLREIFPRFDTGGFGIFRVLRDSDLEIEEEAHDLVQTFQSALKLRRRGGVIRLSFASGVPERIKTYASGELRASPEDVEVLERLVGISDVRQLIVSDRADLLFRPYTVRFPERIRDFGGDCFAAIRAKDIVVHHPYESFDVVVRFLRQAADDPSVVAIKQTLYRTSDDSPIVTALVDAAESGKSVTALVELKARFDEERNIGWARRLERAGAQVVFGFVDLKTHAKVSLVTRREGGEMRAYVHFGTGNYHPITARIYTDLSFFTCDPSLCRDAARLFNFVTGYAYPPTLEKLAISPGGIRVSLLARIEDEISHARAGRPAEIWAKLNALVDVEIIDALYRASQAGVTTRLVVRGICCLRPGVAGLSERITVKSIVGRFLEHARIVCFGNGHGLPSPAAKVFISSADWMPRNLDHRVETLVPIENPTVHQQILSQIMAANISDEAQSWQLRGDGRYERLAARESGPNAQRYFMTNPSLSGRGHALAARPRSGNASRNWMMED